MVVKKFGVDFWSDGGALTLSPYQVSEDVDVYNVVCTRKHKSEWTISGEIHEDYFTWVNDFTAEHPVFGKVYGNFEAEVYADSEEGFADFWKNHEPDAWDYLDI